MLKLYSVRETRSLMRFTGHKGQGRGGGGKKHSPDKFSVLAYWSRTEKDENMAKRIWTNNCVSFLCAVSMTSTKHWNTGLGSRRQLWDKVFQKLTDDSTYTDFSNFHRINPSKEKLACSQVKMQPMTLLWNHSEERGDQSQVDNKTEATVFGSSSL